MAHLRSGRWDEATGCLGLVLQREPGHAQALMLRSALAMKRGDFAAALEGLEQATANMSVTARSPQVLELKGLALVGLGRIAAAIEVLRDMFASSPGYQEDKARAHIRQVNPTDRSLYWKAPQGLFAGRADTPAVFASIYERGVWGGGSGAGSDIERTVMYAGLVQHLIATRAVRRVVDLGCGDWRFSRHLDLTGVDYLGIDVVPAVIAANNAQYAKSGIRFEVADAASFALPDCDLVLCKDVLQHLSNQNVLKVCGRRARGTRWLITNDFHPTNEDCENGDTRPLNPAGAPFSLPARPVLAFGRKVAFLAEEPAR